MSIRSAERADPRRRRWRRNIRRRLRSSCRSCPPSGDRRCSDGSQSSVRVSVISRMTSVSSVTPEAKLRIAQMIRTRLEAAGANQQSGSGHPGPPGASPPQGRRDRPEPRQGGPRRRAGGHRTEGPGGRGEDRQPDDPLGRHSPGGRSLDAAGAARPRRAAVGPGARTKPRRRSSPRSNPISRSAPRPWWARRRR